MEELEKRQKKQRSIGWKMAYAVAACLVVCLALVGGYHLYFSPTTIISIDVNPSIELSVNRFDKVVAVEGWNEDGTAFAETLDVMYQDYQDAVEEILESDTITQCLARDELLSVAVVEIDETQGEAVLEYVSQCTAQQENTYCYGVTSDEVEEAHSLGLSYGKYKVYEEIAQYTTQLSPEEANNMTMRQLRITSPSCKAKKKALPDRRETLPIRGTEPVKAPTIDKEMALEMVKAQGWVKVHKREAVLEMDRGPSAKEKDRAADASTANKIIS